jgi:hypothetical protein
MWEASGKDPGNGKPIVRWGRKVMDLQAWQAEQEQTTRHVFFFQKFLSFFWLTAMERR